MQSYIILPIKRRPRCVFNTLTPTRTFFIFFSILLLGYRNREPFVVLRSCLHCGLLVITFQVQRNEILIFFFLILILKRPVFPICLKCIFKDEISRRYYTRNFYLVNDNMKNIYLFFLNRKFPSFKDNYYDNLR